MCDQQRLRSACAYAQSDQSLCKSLEYSMSVKLLTEHHLEFLSLKGGCTGSSESTLVKMPHRWKAHVGAHVLNSWTMGSMSHLLSIRFCHTGIYVLVLFLCQVFRLNLRDDSSKCLNVSVLIID